MKKSITHRILHPGIFGRLNLLFIQLSTIPIILLSIYILHEQTQILQNDALRSVKNQVNDIKSKTLSMLMQVKQQMNIISRTTEIQKYINSFLLNESPFHLARELTIVENEFINLLKDNNLYFKIELLDKSGRRRLAVFFDSTKVFTIPKKELSKTPLYFYLHEVENMKHGEIKLSPSEIKEPRTKKRVPAIDCIMPIYDENHQRTAILIASFHAEEFFKNFTLSNTDTNIKVIMVNGEGFYLYHSIKKKNWNRLLAARQEENLQHDYDSTEANKILKQMGGTITEDPKRIIEFSTIFSQSDSPTNRYIVFTEIPKSVVFASVNKFRTLMITICIVAAFLSIITGFYTSRHFLRPIKRLVEGTKIIREGNLDYKLDVQTHDELQDLTESFNEMVVQWKQKRELEQQQRLEEDIKERKKYLDNIMDSSLDLLITLSAEGNLSFANRRLEDELGYRFQDVKGMHYLSFFPENQHAFLTEKLEEVRNSNGVVYDTQLIKRDASVIDCLVSISPLKGLNEYLVVIKDITQRKQAELAILTAKEKAEEANQLKTNILANMGHELRTPMIGILGFSKMLHDTKDEQEVLEIGQMIYQSSKRLMETLNLILDLSEIESGDYIIKKNEVYLCEIAEASIDKYKDDALQKGVEIKLIAECNPEEYIILSDSQALSKIFGNIIDNAVKFTNAGSINILINLDKIRKNAIVEIRDTGIGIAEDIIESIFEPFRQGSEGLSRTHEGTGLGLTLTKKYVDLIGGEISVQSSFGKGTSFFIKLPANNKS
ncbi:MAG: hypothetical protein HW421_1857 [Ignavibacteria bacterium]|nr:hypothetical protein [Ignavibacteria bacterium]